MVITVVGSGYVGLVVAACLAETGNDVTCVDCDEANIRTLWSGVIPIFEPGLPELVNQAAGRLTFTTELVDAVRRSRIVFIAVGTPQDEDGSADLRDVFSASRDIARAINDYTLIVIKSTVPVGTARGFTNSLAVRPRIRSPW
jgi:UDPglucose 6-dehydrogenase